MKRRILSIFMALAMCVSLLPTVALADQESDPDGGQGSENAGIEAHECIFEDGWCECGKEEPAAPQAEQNLNQYALRTTNVEPGSGAAAQTLEPIAYIDANGEQQSCDAYTELNSDVLSNYEINDNCWYVVSKDMTISKKLTIMKNIDANLILCDGVTLTVKGGLKGQVGSTLHIYGQSAGTGKMDVSGAVDVFSGYEAAIYMDDSTLELNGGILTSELESGTEGYERVGICTNHLTVNGGELNAIGGKQKMGDDTAETNTGIVVLEDMTVNGGEVNAVGGASRSTGYGYSLGIDIDGAALTVTGGEVNVTGGEAIADITGAGDEEEYVVFSYGIYVGGYEDDEGDFVPGSITVSGNGKLNATAGAVTVTENANSVGGLLYGSSSGIFAESDCDLTVEDGGEMKAAAGKVDSADQGNSSGIYSYAGVTVENGGKLTAAGKDVTAAAHSESFGIYCREMAIAGKRTAVDATSGNAVRTSSEPEQIYNTSISSGIDLTKLEITGGTVTAMAGKATESNDIYGDLTLSGGKVRKNENGAAVRVFASSDNYGNEYSLKVSGGSMKLAENSLVNVSVSNGVELSDLLDRGCAYQNIANGKFVTLYRQTGLENVIVKQAASDSPRRTGGSKSKITTASTSASASTYSVSASAAANGTISVSTENAEKGDIVTIKVDAESGYTLETLQVLDENGNEIPLIDNGDGTFSFEMPEGQVEVKQTFAEDNSILNFFGDVPTNSYFYDAALWAAKNGITGGIDENNFGPHQSCGREQLVTFLWRAANKTVVDYAMNFADVRGDAYYSEAIRWAASMGIVSGYENGMFGTGDSITREQMVVILYRFAQAMGMDTTQGSMTIQEFSDYESISEYALEAMQWAVNMEILHGYDNTLMPDQPCTRAQIVAMLYRLMGQA